LARKALTAETAEQLLANSDGMTNADLAKRAGAGRDQVLLLLRELEQARRVRRTGQRRATRWRAITDEDRIRERAAEFASGETAAPEPDSSPPGIHIAALTALSAVGASAPLASRGAAALPLLWLRSGRSAVTTGTARRTTSERALSWQIARPSSSPRTTPACAHARRDPQDESDDAAGCRMA
jgi:hypothetical protein